MIKVDKGDVEMHGTAEDICTDIACALQIIKATLSKKFGESFASGVLERACKLGLMSDEEVRQKQKETMKQFNRGLLATLTKAMLEDD